ncbi:MAG: C40 family peptidase [Alistipes sp.]|nr:C40 family peptidase [Alistipes sp.]
MTNILRLTLCTAAVLMTCRLATVNAAACVGHACALSVVVDGHADELPVAVSRVDSLLAEAKCHIGKRYKYGSSGINTFDCSGYTSYVFGKYGYKLERSSRAQALQGTAVSREELMPGDLVMFAGRKVSKSRVGHVGIVVSVDRATGDFKFIHACSRGVMISDFASERYYVQSYICARRLLSLDDYKQPLVSIGAPVAIPEADSGHSEVTVQTMDIRRLCLPACEHKSKKRMRRRR